MLSRSQNYVAYSSQPIELTDMMIAQDLRCDSEERIGSSIGEIFQSIQQIIPKKQKIVKQNIISNRSIEIRRKINQTKENLAGIEAQIIRQQKQELITMQKQQIHQELNLSYTQKVHQKRSFSIKAINDVYGMKLSKSTINKQSQSIGYANFKISQPRNLSNQNSLYRSSMRDMQKVKPRLITQTVYQSMSQPIHPKQDVQILNKVQPRTNKLQYLHNSLVVKSNKQPKLNVYENSRDFSTAASQKIIRQNIQMQQITKQNGIHEILKAYIKENPADAEASHQKNPKGKQSSPYKCKVQNKNLNLYRIEF